LNDWQIFRTKFYPTNVHRSITSFLRMFNPFAILGEPAVTPAMTMASREPRAKNVKARAKRFARNEPVESVAEPAPKQSVRPVVPAGQFLFHDSDEEDGFVASPTKAASFLPPGFEEILAGRPVPKQKPAAKPPAEEVQFEVGFLPLIEKPEEPAAKPVADRPETGRENKPAQENRPKNPPGRGQGQQRGRFTPRGNTGRRPRR
jgi:hypothetical protein